MHLSCFSKYGENRGGYLLKAFLAVVYFRKSCTILLNEIFYIFTPVSPPCAIDIKLFSPPSRLPRSLCRTFLCSFSFLFKHLSLYSNFVILVIHFSWLSVMPFSNTKSLTFFNKDGLEIGSMKPTQDVGLNWNCQISQGSSRKVIKQRFTPSVCTVLVVGSPDIRLPHLKHNQDISGDYDCDHVAIRGPSLAMRISTKNAALYHGQWCGYWIPQGHLCGWNVHLDQLCNDSSELQGSEFHQLTGRRLITVERFHCLVRWRFKDVHISSFSDAGSTPKAVDLFCC